MSIKYLEEIIEQMCFTIEEIKNLAQKVKNKEVSNVTTYFKLTGYATKLEKLIDSWWKINNNKKEKKDDR